MQNCKPTEQLEGKINNKLKRSGLGFTQDYHAYSIVASSSAPTINLVGHYIWNIRMLGKKGGRLIFFFFFSSNYARLRMRVGRREESKQNNNNNNNNKINNNKKVCVVRIQIIIPSKVSKQMQPTKKINQS